MFSVDYSIMLMLSQSEALCFESEWRQNTRKMADMVNPVAFPGREHL